MSYSQIIKPLLESHLLAFALRDQSGRWDVGNCLLAGMASAVLAAGLWWAAEQGKKWYRQRIATHPLKLFADLCQSHKLDRNQQRLLMLVAQWHHLPQPAEVFLRPELFHVDHLGPQFAVQIAQIQKVQQQLFGTDIQPAHLSQAS
jgi:hypothetical protein